MFRADSLGEPFEEADFEAEPEPQEPDRVSEPRIAHPKGAKDPR